MKIYTILTGEDDPLVQQYVGNLKKWENFCNKHSVFIGHLKKTCPNPHTGEPHSQRIWGMILDIENKVALFCTKFEYNLMKSTDSEGLEMELEKLLSADPFHDYRGKIAGKRYGI